MAQQFIFNCNKCSFSIKDWDEGNPYEISSKGERKYIYHPSDLSFTVGNAPDYICRNCYKVSKIDKKIDKLKCNFCNSIEIERVFSLGNKKCIKCDGVISKTITGAIS